MNESRTYDSEFSESKLNKVALEIKKGSAVHSPKLNIYKLTLRSSRDSCPTFRNSLISKLNFSKYDKTSKDKELFESYFKSLIQNISGYKKNRKIIYCDDTHHMKLAIKLEKGKPSYIDGVIKGGKYGIIRELANTADKTKENTPIYQEHAVLDWYYLLIYTPLNSGIGFLLIQSYTEESVTNSIKNFITDFFSNENHGYEIKIEPELSKKFIKEYMKSSKICQLGFTSQKETSDSLKNAQQTDEEIYDVEIKITPSSKASSISEFIKQFQERHNKFPLSGVRVHLQDDNRRDAIFDPNKRILDIDPTIYLDLEREKITCDEKTGMPDFEKIQSYCRTVLKEIKQKYKI